MKTRGLKYRGLFIHHNNFVSSKRKEGVIEKRFINFTTLDNLVERETNMLKKFN